MADPVPSSTNVSFRQSVYVASHPQMEADVVIVGGGPAGLACALRLSQLIDKHNSFDSGRKLSKENIFVLEKARSLGAHALSGALLDPRSMQELLPGFESEAPLDATVSRQSVYFLTRKSKFKLPVIPGPLRDQGHHVISLNRFVKWLGGKVEEAGITVFTGFAGSLLLFEDNRVVGVRTEDKGVDRHGQLKSNFEPGYDLKAKVVVLAEGARGSLAKQLFEHCGLQQGPNPQTFGVGVKELWEIPPGRIAPAQVIYTLGWPLTTREYGGSWIYGMTGNIISLGFVTGLHYADPRTDPQHILQSFKQHPFVAKLLDGGKILGYGAKALPYGGWWSIPPLSGDGWMILGIPQDSSMRNGSRAYTWPSKVACSPPRQYLIVCVVVIFLHNGSATSEISLMTAGSSRSSGRCATSIRASNPDLSKGFSMPGCSNSQEAVDYIAVTRHMPGIPVCGTSRSLHLMVGTVSTSWGGPKVMAS